MGTYSTWESKQGRQRDDRWDITVQYRGNTPAVFERMEVLMEQFRRTLIELNWQYGMGDDETGERDEPILYTMCHNVVEDSQWASVEKEDF